MPKNPEVSLVLIFPIYHENADSRYLRDSGAEFRKCGRVAFPDFELDFFLPTQSSLQSDDVALSFIPL